MPWNILLPMALPLIFGVMGRSFPAHAHLFVRAYGQTLSKVCHHQLLLEMFINIFSAQLILSIMNHVTQRINDCQAEI
jgi:hypothetical protein